MKTLKYILSTVLLSFAMIQLGFAAPDIECGGLPGCGSDGVSGVGIYGKIGGLIALLIKYIAVIAVIAVMIGGIMFLVSSGDEEKTKKAKSIITWALVGVFVSISAWSIINIINNFSI